MIQLQDIAVQFGDRALFRNVSFQINQGDKIALIGRNGVGKSTLFQIIDDQLSPDQGSIHMQKGIRIGHLQQMLVLDTTITVRSAAEEAFSEVLALEKENERLQEKMAIATDYESPAYLQLIESFNLNLERLNHFDASAIDKKIELVLKGLGFVDGEFDKKLDTLSGGWQMRVQLAKLLLEQPDLLLLDEPTNHLDIEAIIWLEQYLGEYPGAIIVISHDKAFLRNTALRIIEIENSKVYDYPLKYDRYLVQKAEVRTQQEAAYRNQQKEIARKEKTIKRFMAKATKTSMAQSMKKQLEKVERIELDAIDQADMRIKFLPVTRSARTVLKVKELSKSYRDKSVLQKLSFEIERGDRIAIVGQNGQGKTTLIKTVLGHTEATGGSFEIGSQVSIGYYAQNQSDLLEENETILEFMELRAPDGLRSRVRNILGAFMFSGEDAEKKIKVLSGGERARVAFAHLLMQPINFLILDEPTNHLDMDSKEVLRQALIDYPGTLLVVSHDRDFLTGITTKTLELRDRHVFEYLGDVNYFLEKRALEDMRAVALAPGVDKKASKPKETAPTPTLNREARKALQKRVKQAERSILKLESEIETFEQKMATADFYQQGDAEAVTQNYQSAKDKLKEVEMEWEQAVEELQKHGIDA